MECTGAILENRKKVLVEKISGIVLLPAILAWLAAGRLGNGEIFWSDLAPWFYAVFLLAAAVAAASFRGVCGRLGLRLSGWRLVALGTVYYVLWSGFFFMIFLCV